MAVRQVKDIQVEKNRNRLLYILNILNICQSKFERQRWPGAKMHFI